MNEELTFILLTMSQHKLFMESSLCNVANYQFSQVDDICDGDRCKVCPLGISHIAERYLEKVLSIRAI